MVRTVPIASGTTIQITAEEAILGAAFERPAGWQLVRRRGDPARRHAVEVGVRQVRAAQVGVRQPGVGQGSTRTPAKAMITPAKAGRITRNIPTKRLTTRM